MATTTTCPPPNPTPDCNGTLVPIYHPITHCLIGYNCYEQQTTTTTTTIPPTCPSVDRDCFRQEQRSRRVRAAPQDPPFISYSASEETTTTTTTTTTYPPQGLLDLISIPDSGDYIICPALDREFIPMYFDAYGGDEKIEYNNRIVHKYYSDGIFQIQPYDENIFDYASVEIFLVGGGGGGGAFDGGGGGGAGQVKKIFVDIPKGVYSVNIGQGGSIGFNGSSTSIKELGINSQGGGGGGSAFTANAQSGASGGGAGGKSNSSGAIGINGNNGGSSLGQYGGGGGGGAGQAGQSVPVEEDGVAVTAGKGGDGVSYSVDGSTVQYFAGGGAGDDFGGLVIDRSLGGGGGTIQKNGIDGTGSGGAGNGGSGGKGFCAISYIPVTTPAPTTTTTRAPTPPDIFSFFFAEGLPESVKILWKDPLDVGTSEIVSYTFKVYDVAEVVVEITLDVDSVSTEEIDGVIYKTHIIDSLNDEYPYSVVGFSTNSQGNSALSSYEFETVTTTPPITTTIPPEFVSFIIDFQADVTNGFLGTDEVTINGPENTLRNATAQIVASGGYVFYDPPAVSVFGDGSSNILEDNISALVSQDKTQIDITIPIVMPDRPVTRSLVYFSAEAEEPTTTTTTTTTTTLPPLCLSIYESSDDFILNPSGQWVQPSEDSRLLNPLQIFVAKRRIPYQITGTVIGSDITSGFPWRNGIYFEIGRPASTVEDYIAGLPEDHHSVLLVENLPDGTQNTIDIEHYLLAYPTITNNQINYTLDKVLSVDDNNNFHTISVKCIVDYVCSLDNIQPYGAGDESVSGFTSLVFKEKVNNVSQNMFADVITSNNFRQTGSFTSSYTAETYYFMIDFGTYKNVVK